MAQDWVHSIRHIQWHIKKDNPFETWWSLDDTKAKDQKNTKPDWIFIYISNFNSLYSANSSWEPSYTKGGRLPFLDPSDLEELKQRCIEMCSGDTNFIETSRNSKWYQAKQSYQCNQIFTPYWFFTFGKNIKRRNWFRTIYTVDLQYRL